MSADANGTPQISTDHETKTPERVLPSSQTISRGAGNRGPKRPSIFFPPVPPPESVDGKERAREEQMAAKHNTGGQRGGGHMEYVESGDDHKNLPIQLLSALSFRYKDQGRRKAEAIFVPKGVQLNSKKIETLVTETWGLSMPNMIISCDAGSAHPITLATKILCQGNAFRQWAAEARAQTAKTKKGDSQDDLSIGAEPPIMSSFEGHSIRPPNFGLSSKQPAKEGGPGRQVELSPSLNAARNDAGAALDDKAISVINQLLYQKLVTVYSAVLDAAQMSNNWIIIDRTKGGSPTAELLLEMAMANVDTRPIVVVIDRASRLKHYNSTVAANQLKYLVDMAGDAVPVGADTGNGSPPQSHVCPSSYSIFDYSDWEMYAELELPCKPNPSHIRKDTGDVAGKRKWMYHYQQAIFSSGTHYVFLDGEDDEFPVESFGPIGSIYAHGGTLAYQRLRKEISTGSPIVMLANTGGATQAFSSLHRAFVSAVHSKKEWAAHDLLPHLEITSEERWAANFGVPEIMMFKEISTRAPILFKKTIVTVDLIRDSAEGVLKTVTGCFAAGGGGIPELGLGDAEGNMIMNAWKRHLILWKNAVAIRKSAHWMFSLVCVMSFLIALASTLYAQVFDESSLIELDRKEWKERYQQLLVVLPVIAALFGTVRSKLRFVEKWKICEYASMQIVSEIYKFRTRTFEYDPARKVDAIGSAEGDSKNENSKPSNSVSNIRDKFTQKVQDIFSEVMESDVGRTGYLFYHDKFEFEDGKTAKRKFREELVKHVLQNIHPEKKTSNRCCEIVEEEDEEAVVDKTEEDDLISPIPIETYIEYRQRPVTMAFQKNGPIISNKISALEMTGTVLMSCGSVLAVIKLGTWVALVIATVAILQNVSEYLGLTQERASINNGLSDLQNLRTWWEALSVVDRRTRKSKELAVCTVEKAIIQRAAARAAAVGGASGVSTSSDSNESSDSSASSQQPETR